MEYIPDVFISHTVKTLIVLSVRFYVTTYRAELKSDKWFVVTSMLH